MLEFISFGSGSSGNCYLLRTDTDALIVDVGVGLRTLKKHFLEYGVSFSDIHNVIVTHDHADHIKSVGSLSNDYHLPVYATAEVHHGIMLNKCVRSKISQADKKIIEKDKTYQLGEFRVTPFHVPHDSIDCVGYRIECQNTIVCIMTDAGAVTEQMQHLIGEANFLVIEADYDIEMLVKGGYPRELKERILGETGHLSNRDCGEAIATYATPALRQVCLCHLSDRNNHPELARKTVEMILRQHGIIAGVDFKLNCLKRNKPTGPFLLAD
jgi:phosphoribosyl 1,2-cyclic phosphodiesterase